MNWRSWRRARLLGRRREKRRRRRTTRRGRGWRRWGWRMWSWGRRGSGVDEEVERGSVLVGWMIDSRATRIQWRWDRLQHRTCLGGIHPRPRTSTQRHAVVPVPLPARLTDAVVDGDVDSRIEVQSEDVGSGERVALLAPRAAPAATPQHWTLGHRHQLKGVRKSPRDSQAR